MRKFQEDYLKELKGEALGEEGDWDLARRARSERAKATDAALKGKAGGEKNEPVHENEESQSAKESESESEKEM